jgi:hypothetical protein
MTNIDTSNINPLISRHDFDRAISMLETMRDRSLEYELDIRADDPLGDFADGVLVAFDMDESHSPDQLLAMLALIDAARD